jgi:hypothetical protein
MAAVVQGTFDASNAHDDPKQASFLSVDYVQIGYGSHELRGRSTYLGAALTSAQRFRDTK